jgi:hypothetical protein
MSVCHSAATQPPPDLHTEPSEVVAVRPPGGRGQRRGRQLRALLERLPQVWGLGHLWGERAGALGGVGRAAGGGAVRASGLLSLA